jgi:hypothetical protein
MKSHRPRPLSLLILALALTGIPVAESQAYRLTNRDLRYYGYVGRYSGVIESTAGFWNGFDYDEVYRRRRDNSTIAAAPRTIVTGPSGRNGFFLTRVSARGNLRRATIRYVYSGVSYNPDYGEDMYGTGQKIVRLARRGFARPRLDMTTSDVLQERSVFDDALFTYWRRFGSYSAF